MSKIVFPIVEVNQNKIVSIDGNVSRFYKLVPPDLEQMAPISKESFFAGLASSLDTLDEKAYFKFYRINGNSYLETNSNRSPSLSNVEVNGLDRPLKVLFGDNGLFSDIGIYDDYLSFNGRYLRILSVLEFSENEIDENYIPRDVNYVLFVKKSSKEKSISKLERIRTGHLAGFFKNKRDISSEGTYNQAENLIFDLVHGNELLFEIELFFLVEAHSIERLNQKTLEFHSEMQSLGVKLLIEGQSVKKLKSGLGRIFNEIVPGVRPTNNLRVHLDKTGHLKFLIPLRRSHLMENGIRFHDRYVDEIFFNPFNPDIKNRNMLVTGTSGAGKSVFVNTLVHSLIADHPTVILDKGGSFKRLTLYHNGEILHDGFNPMQFKDPVYLREIILSVVDAKQFGKLEKGKLLKEIKSILPEVSTFNELLAELGKSFTGIELYFEETKEYFTDTIIDNKKILYVDVENYPRGIIAPLIIFILEYFKQFPAKEKILVFDECWSFLKDHSSYIDECFRTFRKTGAFPIAISQALKDFSSVGSNLGDSITNNSYFKVYFPQELTVSNELTEFDLENISSLYFEKGNFSECYLKTPDNRYQKVIRNYLSPLELELFHTDAGMEDKLLNFVNDLGQYFDSPAQAIESFVRLKHEDNKDDYNFFTTLAKGVF